MTSIERVSIKKGFLFFLPFITISNIADICVFYLLPDASPREVSFPANLIIFPQDISVRLSFFDAIMFVVFVVLIPFMIAWPMRKIRPHVHLSPQANIRWMILGGVLGLAKFSQLGGVLTMIYPVGLIFGYWLAFVKFPPLLKREDGIKP